MEKAHYEIFINASREKTWDTMLDDATYREWTKVFNADSHYIGDWSQGSKILFIGSGEDGEQGGMVARIKENRKYEFISIEHLGMIKDGIEDTTSEEVRSWTPAFENYTFTEKDGGILLEVDMEISADFKAMFDDLWPQSLEVLKSLVEK
jgi:hypothetical protein